MQKQVFWPFGLYYISIIYIEVLSIYQNLLWKPQNISQIYNHKKMSFNVEGKYDISCVGSSRWNSIYAKYVGPASTVASGKRWKSFVVKHFQYFILYLHLLFWGGQKVDVSPIQPQVGTLCRIKGENISVPSYILHVVT